MWTNLSNAQGDEGAEDLHRQVRLVRPWGVEPGEGLSLLEHAGVFCYAVRDTPALAPCSGSMSRRWKGWFLVVVFCRTLWCRLSWQAPTAPSVRTASISVGVARGLVRCIC